jgi:hypothetical protein
VKGRSAVFVFDPENRPAASSLFHLQIAEKDSTRKACFRSAEAKADIAHKETPVAEPGEQLNSGWKAARTGDRTRTTKGSKVFPPYCKQVHNPNYD